MKFAFYTLGCKTNQYETQAMERLLQQKLQQRVLYTDYRRISVTRSVFGGDAPLIGAIACCTEKIFDLTLKILPEE